MQVKQERKHNFKDLQINSSAEHSRKSTKKVNNCITYNSCREIQTFIKETDERLNKIKHTHNIRNTSGTGLYNIK